MPRLPGGRHAPFRQMLDLLESTTAHPLACSAAAVLCRVEGLLLKETCATSVDAFLVDRWFGKLLRFSVATAEEEKDEEEGKDRAGVTAGGSGEGYGTPNGEDGGARGSQGHTPPYETVFEARAVCAIGEGVTGKAAMTGRKLRIRDCRRQRRWQQQQQQQQQHGRDPARSACGYSTPHDRGSLICWPVRKRAIVPGAGAVGGGATAASASVKGPSPWAQLEDVNVGDEEDSHGNGPARAGSGSARGAVLAVLQVHCAEGLLSEEEVGVLHAIGRLLMPLLSEALAREEERVRRRSAEALLSLSSLVPREVSLVDMVEEVVRAAQMLTGAERVCFFFVDDAADELWVAGAVDFDDAKVKVGKGLCGHAVETGGTVNVIDSYQDSRFDRQWDKLTGFVTRR